VFIVVIKNMYDAYSLGCCTKDLNKYFSYCTWISNAITKSDERRIFKENNVFINTVFFVLFLFMSGGTLRVQISLLDQMRRKRILVVIN